MLLIKGAHVVDPQVGLDTVTDVLVEGARIARVGANIKTPEGAEVIDGTGKYLVPGLTDIHVHFRDPGYEYKETIETGSAAAAAGVEVTDEAMAMERQGQRPLLVEGSEDNFKVTTPADLDRFEFVLSRRAG